MCSVTKLRKEAVVEKLVLKCSLAVLICLLAAITDLGVGLV